MVSALGKGKQLGHQHETTLLDAQLGADTLLIARQVETKYPKLAALFPGQAISVHAGLDGVGVVAKKGEVILQQPFEKNNRLLVVLLLDLLRAARLDLGNRHPNPLVHRLVITHDNAYIAQHFLQGLLNVSQHLRTGMAINLDGNQRLSPRRRIDVTWRGNLQQVVRSAPLCRQNGIVNRVNGQASPVEFDTHRIDKERHIFVKHSHERMRGLPAMLCEVRIKNAYLGRGGIKVLDKVPDRQSGTIKIIQTPVDEVFQRNHGVEMPGKSLHFRSPGLLKPTLQAFTQLLEYFLPSRFVHLVLHPTPRLPWTVHGRG